jgi:hypothetical protein
MKAKDGQNSAEGQGWSNAECAKNGKHSARPARILRLAGRQIIPRILSIFYSDLN